VKVLHKKIKDPKCKTRVLPKPNVQKIILDKKSPTKVWGIAFKIPPKNCPTHLFIGKRKVGQKWGLRSRINRYCKKKFDKKNPTHLHHLRKWVGQ